MQIIDKKSTIVVIPARMASTRLPNKPLADINGKPMIVHVLNNAKKADIALLEKSLFDVGDWGIK